jgi:hypothetical protein
MGQQQAHHEVASHQLLIKIRTQSQTIQSLVPQHHLSPTQTKSDQTHTVISAASPSPGCLLNVAPPKTTFPLSICGFRLAR